MFATIRPGLPGRLEVVFPTAPPAEVRGALKARGFRWLARESLWYGPIDALPVEILSEAGVTLRREGEPSPEPVALDSNLCERDDAPAPERWRVEHVTTGARLDAEPVAEPAAQGFRDAWCEARRREGAQAAARALFDAAAAQAAQDAPSAAPEPAPEPMPQPAPIALSTLAPAAAPPRYVRAQASRPARGPAPRKGGGFFDALGV